MVPFVSLCVVAAAVSSPFVRPYSVSPVVAAFEGSDKGVLEFACIQDDDAGLGFSFFLSYTP